MWATEGEDVVEVGDEHVAWAKGVGKALEEWSDADQEQQETEATGLNRTLNRSLLPRITFVVQYITAACPLDQFKASGGPI